MEEALSPEIAEAEVEDVSTRGHKGTGRERVDILARERRRSWTPEQKRAIVAESLGPELTPSEVARKLRDQQWPPGPLPAARSGPDGLIEIVLPMRVSTHRCAGRWPALRRVLGALDG